MSLPNRRLLLDRLRHALATCRRVPRASDTVGRNGGDEFVIVLEDLDADVQAAVAQAETVAEKILRACHSPFRLSAHQQGYLVGRPVAAEQF